MIFFNQSDVTADFWHRFRILTLFTIFHHFSWLMRSPKTPWRISFELLEYQKSIRQSEKLSRNWPILIPVNPVRVYRSTPYPKRSLKRISNFGKNFTVGNFFVIFRGEGKYFGINDPNNPYFLEIWPIWYFRFDL